MQPFYKSYLENLQEYHEEIRKAISGLPQESLNWVPGAEMNSINVLVTHLLGAERYWIGDVVMSEPSGRDRDSEFKVQGLTANELFQKMEGVEAYIRTSLEKLVIEELSENRVSPRNGREIAVGWALLHAMQHTALHVGQIQMTRQLWEQKP